MKRYSITIPYALNTIEQLPLAELKSACLWIAAQIKGRYTLCTKSLTYLLRSKGHKFDLRKRSEWLRLYEMLHKIALKRVHSEIKRSINTLKMDVKTFVHTEVNKGFIPLVIYGDKFNLTKTCHYEVRFQKGVVVLTWRVAKIADPYRIDINPVHTGTSLVQVLNLCKTTDPDVAELLKVC